MEEFDFYGGALSGQKSVICLGAFDAVHRGHRDIILKAKSYAEKINAALLVFGFENDLSLVESNKKYLVYTYAERKEILAECGVYGVIRALFDEKFLKIQPENFLKRLTGNFNPAKFYCGEDYRYGYRAEGNIASLTDYCRGAGVQLEVCPFVYENGVKISASEIKNLLASGEIAKANGLLGEDYFIECAVEEGRREGRKIGFPTANFSLPDEKFKLKRGVYKTYAYIDGVRFDGITNYGTAPTFGFEQLKIETHFKNYDGDLYGKNVKLRFADFLRETVRFSSVDELKNQLKKDLNA